MFIDTDEVYQNEHYMATPYNTLNHEANGRKAPVYCMFIGGYCQKKSCFMCEFFGCDKVESGLRVCPFDGKDCNVYSCKDCGRKKQEPCPDTYPTPKTVEERAHEILDEIIQRDKEKEK